MAASLPSPLSFTSMTPKALIRVMEVEEAAIVAVLYTQLRKRLKRRQRRYWVRPLLQDRSTKGLFCTLYSDLRQNPEKFFSFVHMSIASFDELLECVQDQLTGVDTNMRDSITPVEKLLITLRYLASGCSMTDLHMYFRIGLSTVSMIIKRVCQKIWKTLKHVSLSLPNASRWKCIADGFEAKAHFPNCFGALDGKYVRVIKPQQSGSMGFNYKHFLSIVLLAMCDSNYMFTFVDIGAYSKESDATVVKKSRLYDAIANNKLILPEPTPIREGDDNLPYVMVGGEAFPLSDHVMRPFGKNSLTARRKVYNYRHSLVCRYMECTFGILSNKWRIFHRPMNVDVSLAEDIIKACCILHNYVLGRDGYNFEESLTVDGFADLQTDLTSRGTKSAISIRDKFADYFVRAEGELEWQYRVI